VLAEEDHVMSVSAEEFKIVRYHFLNLFEESKKDEPLPEIINKLTDAIREALAEPWRGTRGGTRSIRTPRESRIELAARIEETAEVIRLLRINSTGDAIDELLSIATDLKKAGDQEPPSALREAGEKVLSVIARIADQLATVRGARFAISGALALVLGGSGLPAVTAFGLGLAFWEGKDAFLKALDRNALRNGTAPAAKQDKPLTKPSPKKKSS
jgi:hypothetical protein